MVMSGECDNEGGAWVSPFTVPFVVRPASILSFPLLSDSLPLLPSTALLSSSLGLLPFSSSPSMHVYRQSLPFYSSVSTLPVTQSPPTDPHLGPSSPSQPD
ncbi:hypothetical protein E2C01_084366 [Portunus trituberculatus]|uniref:Uncharacterized protein n=1 Tax=Portunus trituberculatus TaxID=210409 RepID=A0A5B7IY24_PORTR|nr:hypothetical protein [Portunus trituberculatus]